MLLFLQKIQENIYGFYSNCLRPASEVTEREKERKRERERDRESEREIFSHSDSEVALEYF